MGRSQRHKVIVQQTDSSGKGLSEKQPAPVYVIQFNVPQAFSVPVGGAGGPLKGSTLAGFPPTLIPPPGLLATLEAEVQATGDFSDPGQFNLSGNPIYQDLPAPEESGGVTPIPEPEPGEEPTIVALNPDNMILGYPDLSMHVMGTNFTDTSVITFNGDDVPTEFVDDNHLITLVYSSTATTAGVFPVTVKQGSYETAPVDFTFSEDVAQVTTPTGEREFPLGPFDISLVTGDGEKLFFSVPAGSDVRVGDSVTVEATGNTSVNGTYTVSNTAPNAVIVDSDVELTAAIENKGRLIVTDGA